MFLQRRTMDGSGEPVLIKDVYEVRFSHIKHLNIKQCVN